MTIFSKTIFLTVSSLAPLIAISAGSLQQTQSLSINEFNFNNLDIIELQANQSKMEHFLKNDLSKYIDTTAFKVYGKNSKSHKISVSLPTHKDALTTIEKQLNQLTKLKFKLKLLEDTNKIIDEEKIQIIANLYPILPDSGEQINLKLTNKTFNIMANLKYDSDYTILKAVDKTINTLKNNACYPNLRYYPHDEELEEVFEELYERYFSNYDEVVEYLNNQMNESIWTSKIKVSLQDPHLKTIRYLYRDSKICLSFLQSNLAAIVKPFLALDLELDNHEVTTYIDPDCLRMANR